MHESTSNPINQRRFPMEVLIVIGFLAAWILLQIFVLPKFGVST